MDSFLLCLLLTFAIAMGGRDQLLVAQLSELLERSAQLLVMGAVCSAISAAVMVWTGMTIAQIMPPRAAQMLVAFALAIAAFELAWPVKVRQMDEPTRSLGAIAAVLLARQLGDGARFIIFAFAAQAIYPATALIGGALGGSVALALGWSMGRDLEAKLPLRWVRLGLAACLIVAALFIGLNARYPRL